MYVCIQPWNTLYQGNSMDFTSLLSLACEKKKNSNKKINSATLLQFFMFFSLLYAVVGLSLPSKWRLMNTKKETRGVNWPFTQPVSWRETEYEIKAFFG